jgi:hypothetical protein
VILRVRLDRAIPVVHRDKFDLSSEGLSREQQASGRATSSAKQVCRSNRLQLNLHDPEAAAVTASRSGAATSGRCRQVRPADRPAAQPDADGGGLLR